jgi:hypothetical protein
MAHLVTFIYIAIRYVRTAVHTYHACMHACGLIKCMHISPILLPILHHRWLAAADVRSPDAADDLLTYFHSSSCSLDKEQSHLTAAGGNTYVSAMLMVTTAAATKLSQIQVMHWIVYQ